MSRYELIVVGAGPAGSIAAWKAAKLGLRVLLLERARLPRRKCCAGGITARTLNFLKERGLLSKDVPLHQVKRGRLYLMNAGKFVEFDFRCWMTLRAPFDASLAAKAAEAGAELKDGEPVKDVKVEKDKVLVRTSEAEYEAPALIGADGAPSTVAARLGMKPGYIEAFAIEFTGERPAGFDPECCDFYFYLPGVRFGYLWIFPNGPRTANYGFGSYLEVFKGKDAARLLEHYLGLSRAKVKVPRAELRGAIVPLYGGQGPESVLRDRVVLAGDAAGFVFAASGGGISNALISGEIAAEAMAKALEEGDLSAAKLRELYWGRLERELIPELKASLKVHKLTRDHPRIVAGLLVHDEEARRLLGRLLAEEIGYVEYMKATSRFSKIVRGLLGALRV